MITSLLLAVVAVGVGAGAVAVVDETEGRVPVVAREIVAGTLAVELAEAIADVTAGLVVGHELLGSETGGAGIAHVDTRRHAGSSRKDLQRARQSDECLCFQSSTNRLCSISVDQNASSINMHACSVSGGCGTANNTLHICCCFCNSTPCPPMQRYWHAL